MRPIGACVLLRPRGETHRYFIAERLAPAPHFAHSEGCAAIRIMLVTVLRVSRSCEHFPDGFYLHLLRPTEEAACRVRMTSRVAPAHPQLFKMGAVTPLHPLLHHVESARNLLSKQ